MKKNLTLVFLLFLNLGVFAQVKIGKNPVTITTNKVFEIEADNAKKFNVNQTDGKAYLENKPTAVPADSLLLSKVSDGEIRQMSINRLFQYMDLDGDGIPSINDPDDDGDGIPDSTDKCPLQYGCAAASDTVSTHGCPYTCFNQIDDSSNGTAVITSFDNCAVASAGSLTKGTAVGTGVTQTIQVTTSKAGSYNISATAHGVTFAGSGNLIKGTQNIILTATGTPTVAGTDTFKLNTTPNCSFTRAITSGSTNGTGDMTLVNCSNASAGSLALNKAVSGVTQTIQVNVTALGTYNLSATTNGVTFAKTGTFTTLGLQTIVLAATGTPTVQGDNVFTLNTTPNCTFTRSVGTDITISSLPAKDWGYNCNSGAQGANDLFAVGWTDIGSTFTVVGGSYRLSFSGSPLTVRGKVTAGTPTKPLKGVVQYRVVNTSTGTAYLTASSGTIEAQGCTVRSVGDFSANLSSMSGSNNTTTALPGGTYKIQIWAQSEFGGCSSGGSDFWAGCSPTKPSGGSLTLIAQ